MRKIQKEVIDQMTASKSARVMRTQRGMQPQHLKLERQTELYQEVEKLKTDTATTWTKTEKLRKQLRKQNLIYVKNNNGKV